MIFATLAGLGSKMSKFYLKPEREGRNRIWKGTVGQVRWRKRKREGARGQFEGQSTL